jgi:hypothetical protein
MGDGQTVFLFCVVYSGILSLVVFANLVVRERRTVPLPPQREQQVPIPVPFKKEA